MDFAQKIKAKVDFNQRQQQAEANVLAEKTKNSKEILKDFLGTDIFELFAFLNKTYYGEFSSSSYPYGLYNYKLNLPESFEAMFTSAHSHRRQTDGEGNIRFNGNLYGSSCARKGLFIIGVKDFKPYVSFQYNEGEQNTKWTDDVSGFIELVLGYIATELSEPRHERECISGKIRERKNFDGELK